MHTQRILTNYYHEFTVTKIVTKNIMTIFYKARLNYAPINVISHPPGRGAYGGINGDSNF